MKKVYSPYWLLFTVTIPQIIIFVIFSGIFKIINSELTEKYIANWIAMAGFLGILCLGITIYAGYCIAKKEYINKMMGFILLGLYIPFYFIYLIKSSEIIPSGIPDWMMFGVEPDLYMMTFIMPIIIYSLLLIVIYSCEKNRQYSVSLDILYIFLIPTFWYLIFFTVIPLVHTNFTDVIENLGFLFFILTGFAFLFFIMRAVYLYLKRNPKAYENGIFIITLICPIMGLALNESIGNIFGNFTSIYFYIFAIATGIILIIPLVQNKKIRLALFIGKSITFVYTLYFFIVFLPYFPFSIIIMIFGFGILMISPLILMFIHVNSLYLDYKYLKDNYNKKLIILILVIGILTIPVSIGFTVENDRGNLDTALKFAYQQNLNEYKELNLNINAVKRSLENIKSMKEEDSRGWDIITKKIPYISAFYNWYVLDNLSISNEKIKKLEFIFLGKTKEYFSDTMEDINKDVIIDNIRVETRFDSKNKVYKSWIDFELKNKSDIQSEYDTYFKLPSGSYISNYYLYVNKQKKYGLISDKRAANWIYNQIKSVRRDPGILYYTSLNEIAFKVFPFEPYQIRRTGIEIVHKSSAIVKIDGKEIVLNTDNSVVYDKEIKVHPDVVFIPKNAKLRLLKVIRKPKYYFVVDYSTGNEKNIKNYFLRVKNFAQKNKIDILESEIIAVNFNERKVDLNNNWEKSLINFKSSGGFFLENTIKKILYKNYNEKSKYYPVIIAVTDNLENAVLPNDFYDFKFTFPDSEFYYHLNSKEDLYSYSLLKSFNKDFGIKVKDISSKPVLPWPDEKNIIAYLPDDKEDSVVLKNENIKLKDKQIKYPQWESGVILQGMYMHYILHPENYFEESLSMVKNSIANNVMSPLTSFIVLENKAQEKVLLKKQKQILATKKPLDVGEQMEMSEPSLSILILILGMFIWFINYKKKKAVSK